MKITGKIHVTATEKKHIKAIIAKGWMAGSTNRKFYELVKSEDGYVVTIKTPEINDHGKRQTRVSTAYVVL